MLSVLRRALAKGSIVQTAVCSYSTTKSKEARELGFVIENVGNGEMFGQPTPFSHPHLLSSGEVVSGIQKDEFVERRNNLIKNVLRSSPNKDNIVIIPSASRVYMSEKIPYVFRQNTDFHYLTGCLEPDCTLVITASSEDNITSTLFLRKKDKHAEKWDGPRTGPEGASRLFGVDQALPFTELKMFLSSYTKSTSGFTLWYDFASKIHPDVHSVMENCISSVTGNSVESPQPLVHRQRLIKSAAEQRLMARTCDVACRAMADTIRRTHPGITEHQLFARMDFECRDRGAEYLAYPPVVAAGNNANTIHYINNTQRTKPGDMVLMDAGCSVSGYCSDLTRTWPVSGQFSDAQLVLYEIVYETQRQLISLCRPPHSLDHLFNVMCVALGQQLMEAGVFKKSADKSNPAKMAYDLCPHHSSHYLGMDVHDTGTVSRNIPMQPGMVITVEPGLYVSYDNDVVHEEFRGQGIRIEDNILVTENNPIVLTATCPKESDLIQKLVGSKSEV